jgi:hypothetical protein
MVSALGYARTMSRGRSLPLTVTRSVASTTSLAPALTRVADSSVPGGSAVVVTDAPVSEDAAAKLQDLEFESPPGYVAGLLSEQLEAPKKNKR